MNFKHECEIREPIERIHSYLLVEDSSGCTADLGVITEDWFVFCIRASFLGIHSRSNIQEMIVIARTCVTL